jgi:hypothetical protein
MADNTPLQDFMNPKSSLTLGAASAMVIAFTTTLALSFHWPQPAVALSLSALFAFLQVSAATDLGPIVNRFGYFVVITLVIFNAARGGTSTLSDGEAAIRAAPPVPAVSLVSAAYAIEQVSTNTPPADTNAPPPQIFLKW